MQKIFINKQGFAASKYITDATIPVEVSDKVFEQLETVKFGHSWKYDSNTGIFNQEPLLTVYNLKELRQLECFDIIDNRSILWFNHLTSEQQQELDTWYKAWLDVTDTKIIPDKPEWLK